MEKLSELLANSTVRYVLVGGSAYVIEIAIILTAQKVNINSIFAVALSFWVGLVYTFILQKFFSFKDRRTERKLVASQVFMVTALVIFNFVFTIAVTALLRHEFPAIVIRTGAIAITVMWNYYLYKKHIFKAVVVD